LDRQSESRAIRRIRIIARLAGLWAGLLLLKLVYLQVIAHDELEKIALYQHLATLQVDAPR
jgi:hypothetical protein